NSFLSHFLSKYPAKLSLSHSLVRSTSTTLFLQILFNQSSSRQFLFHCNTSTAVFGEEEGLINLFLFFLRWKIGSSSINLILLSLISCIVCLFLNVYSLFDAILLAEKKGCL